jgi:hypothetical protein
VIRSFFAFSPIKTARRWRWVAIGNNQLNFQLFGYRGLGRLATNYQLQLLEESKSRNLEILNSAVSTKPLLKPLTHFTFDKLAIAHPKTSAR